MQMAVFTREVVVLYVAASVNIATHIAKIPLIFSIRYYDEFKYFSLAPCWTQLYILDVCALKFAYDSKKDLPAKIYFPYILCIL